MLLGLTLCSKDYNPFSDPENCEIHFLSQISDTINIFSTHTDTVIFTAPSLVKKLTIEAKKNRYFDTTGIANYDSPGSGQHNYSFSFYDTGMMNINFRLEKTNGEIVEKELNCYVKSPLRNSTLTGGYDSSHPQTFKAGRVLDPDVIYQWIFGRYNQVDLLKPETTGVLIDKIPENGYGLIRITDKKYTSPADTFTYSLVDITPPQLEFKDSVTLIGDTLICSGESFYLNIQISDPGCGIVQEVRINGNSEVDKENIIKEFSSNVGVINILLRDGSKWHNETTLKYYVKIDSGVITPDANLRFKILPDEDSITVNTPFFKGFTYVEYYDKRTLYHRLNIFSNEQNVDSIEVSRVQYSIDSFTVALPLGWTTVKAELIDKELRKAVDTAIVAVKYDPEYKIDKKPTIFDVRFVNARISRGQVVLNTDSLELMVVAIDDKGKVKKVVADSNSLSCNNNSNQWSGRIPVFSKATGNAFDSIKVTAIDSAEQSDDTTFIVVKNTRPLFSVKNHKVQIVAGNIYLDTLRGADEDGDKLTYSIVENAGKNVKIDAVTGHIHWNTTLSDVNKAGYLFRFSVTDGYDLLVDSVRVIVLKDSSDSIPPVQFITKPSDISSDIEAGLNYAYKLKFVKRPDSLSYSLKTDMDSIIIKDDTLILKPQPADTGYHRVTLVAKNLMDQTASLYLDFYVQKANSKPVIKADSLLFKNGVPGISVVGSIDSFLTFSIWIDDPDFNDRNVLKTGVKNLFANAKIQLLPDSNNHYELLLFNNSNIKGEDTLLVFCEDHGGLVDTLKIPVHYSLKVYPVDQLSPAEGEYIQSDTVLFRWNRCGGNENVNYLFQTGLSQDSIVRTVSLKDTSLIQVVRKSDTYRWRITVASGRDTAYGEWQYFSLHSPTHIEFGNDAGKIKNYCFADVDTYSLKLQIKEGTGCAKRDFTAALIGKTKTFNINVNSNEVLTWIPTVNDTGTYLLNVRVVDSIGNADTLQTHLSVVSASGCHISVKCSDTALYCDSAVDLYGEDRETNLIISIDRSRRSVFDTFNITVTSHGYAVNVDADSAVMVLQRPLKVIADDTLIIIARNKSNNITSKIEKVIVRYNVPEKSISIGAGTLALNDGLSKIPVLIRLDKNNIGFTKKCGFRFLTNGKTDTLVYQINTWNQSSKTAEVWVLFDTIVPSGNTTCIMEYGYQLPDRSNGKSVFDTLDNFGAVYHFEGLNEKPNVVKDESGAANNGNFQNNKYEISTRIGSAVSFSKTTNQISLQKKVVIAAATDKTITFESWAKMNFGSGVKSLFDIKISPFLQCSFVSETGFLKVKYRYDDVGDGSMKFDEGNQDALLSASNEWVRLAFSLSVLSDKVSYTIFANGAELVSGYLLSLSQSFIDNLTWEVGTVMLGSTLDYYDGQFDEVWVSKIKRSDDWYKFTYENQKEKSSLVKIENVNF